MSDQKGQSDEKQQSLSMDVDIQPNGSSNSQFSAPAAGSSSTGDQISEMETGNDSQTPKLTRRDIDMNRKQRSLAEFLSMMDNYTPAVSEYIVVNSVVDSNSFCAPSRYRMR
jgi:hypothetical protein